MTNIAGTFKAFATSLTDEQLYLLQMKIRLTQFPAVFQIVQAVKSGQPFPHAVLRNFLMSIDEPQMEDFKTVLAEEQYKDLLTAVVSYLQKPQDQQTAFS